MRKKLFSIFLAVFLVCGMSACESADSKISTVTIEENDYDLSGDFLEVVESMTENDISVSLFSKDRLMFGYVFNEDGNVIKVNEYDSDNPIIKATERAVMSHSEGEFAELEEEIGKFVYKQFLFESYNAEFESKLGFSYESGKSDIKELDIFESGTPVMNREYDGFVAVFVDNEAVDFADYQEDFEDWKDTCNDDGVAEAMEECFDNLHYATLAGSILKADFMRSYYNYDEVKDMMKDRGCSIKDEILLAFVMQDACEKLEEGDAESVVTIKVDISDDDDVIMEYTEYYFDEDWDPDRIKVED